MPEMIVRLAISLYVDRAHAYPPHTQPDPPR